MSQKKIFTCEKCDNNIDVEDAWNTDSTVCHNCGQTYRLNFIDTEDEWKLEPVESVEETERDLSELKEEEPFQVLNEPAGPREDDLEKE